jgi:hypothetical protein
MAAFILFAAERLTTSDWGPLLFPKYGSGLLLAFYADESADQKHEKVFVVAGFLGYTKEWLKLEGHWNARLKRDQLAYFHASEYNSLKGGFYQLISAHGPEKARDIADKLYSDLAQLIKSHELYAFCFIVPIPIYHQVRAREFGENCLQKDPYIVAHEQIIFNVAKSAGKAGATQPIAFVFDKHDKAVQLVNNWPDMKSRLPATSPWIGSPSVMNDEKCAQLQAADLIANVAKRAWEKSPDRWAFEMADWRERIAWAGHWSEDYLTALVETSVDIYTSPEPLRRRTIDEL